MKCPTPYILTLALSLGMTTGCGLDSPTSFTRLHLENASDAPVTFFAIGVSEQEVVEADNRLPHPLEPDSVYSALLTRPGNYWVRAEFEEGGHVIERIEGPMRVSRGVSDWQFTTLDARPLYEGQSPVATTQNTAGLSLALVQRAGRMSFSSN